MLKTATKVTYKSAIYMHYLHLLGRKLRTCNAQNCDVQGNIKIHYLSTLMPLTSKLLGSLPTKGVLL